MADVSTTSADYDAMHSYWEKVESILGGVEVMRTKARFLPKFPNETENDYKFRRDNAKLTNIFADIVESLSAKPFSKEVDLAGETKPDWATKFIEDVDASGNHIHVFAGSLFNKGVSDAISWVLVEFTKVNLERSTKAAEEAIGARPYWRNIRAEDIIAAETVMIRGRDEFVHVRIRESQIVREGYEEKVLERVRVLNREKQEDGTYAAATFEVFEKQKDQEGKDVWVSLEGESGKLTIGVIPLVPFITGRRKGTSWQIRPVLQAAVDLQLELYEGENGLKYAKQQTAFPMLAGNGVTPELDEAQKVKPVPVGPKSVLYAPMTQDGNHGEWTFIEPNSTSLQFLADDNKETIAQLRELGRQPLTAQTGNLTVVTTAFAADKANSVIQAWALNLKDCLENCFRFTALWLKKTDEVSIFVDTDFDVNLSDMEGPKVLLDACKAGFISADTMLLEFKRRGLLSAEFDLEEELKLLLPLGNEGP